MRHSESKVCCSSDHGLHMPKPDFDAQSIRMAASAGTGTGNRNRRNRFSRNRHQNRHRRNRLFQKPKPEPCHPLNTALKCTENPFLGGTVGTEKPEPLEPFHTRTVTEPDRDRPALDLRHNEQCCDLPLPFFLFVWGREGGKKNGKDT